MNCFLNISDLTYVPKKKFNETNSLEKIEAANEKREMAKRALANNDLAAADSLYTQATFFLQNTDNAELTDNHDRAAMIESMIACKNNNAMTSLKLKRYKEAIQHATEALLLLDAVYKQRGLKVGWGREERRVAFCSVGVQSCTVVTLC